MSLFPSFHMAPFIISAIVNLSVLLFIVITYKKTKTCKMIINYLALMVINVRRRHTKSNKCDWFFISVFLFLLIHSYTSILGLFSPLSMMSFTAIFIGLCFFYIIFSAVKERRWKVLASFVPSGIPKPIMPLIYLVELLSFCIKPVIYIIRLTLGAAVGHLLVDIFKQIITNYYTLEIALIFFKLFEIATISLQCYLLINGLTYSYSILVEDH